jgi:hypothetical protein
MSIERVAEFTNLKGRLMKAYRSLLSCLALLLAGSFGFAAPADEESPLRYRFKEGEVIQYVLEEKGTAEFAGTKIDATSIIDLKWRVDKVNKNGSVTLTQTMGRIRMEFDIGEKNVKYDSKAGAAPDDPVEKMLTEALGIYVGEEMVLTLDAKGNVESLKFAKKLAEAVDKLSPESKAIVNALSEDGVRRMVAQCLPPLPNAAPSEQKPWESKLSATFAGAAKFTLDNKHTYAGTVTRGGKKLDKIETASTINLAAVDPAAATVKMIEQEAKSTAHIDRASGRLIDSEYSQKVEMEITENGQTVTIKGKTKTTLKLADPK